MAGGRSVMSFRSSRMYHANAEGIRDVKWSPTDGTEFACGTDAGVVQRWDFRRDSAPVLKVTAHRKVCQSIDWHPDGKHLVSGGADKMVSVWDFSSQDRRQNSPWSFRAPQAVTRVRWRPAEWKMSADGIGAWITTQLVTSYSHTEPRVHIWDLWRPTVPSRELDRYNSAPSDILWHSENLLWTVGLEGIFTQTDVQFAPKTKNRRMPQCFDVAPNGELTFFAQQRTRHGVGMDLRPEAILSRRSKQVKQGNGDKLSESRSTTDEELSGSLLGTSFRRHRGRAWSAKSSKSAGNTPPSEGNALVVKKLDEILVKRAYLMPVQIAAEGNIFATLDAATFAYLATNYSITGTDAVDKEFLMYGEHTKDRIEQNALLAEAARMYRVAQTWRILNFALAREQRIREGEKSSEREIQDMKQSPNPPGSHDNTGKVLSKTENVASTSPISYPHLIPGGSITAIVEESTSRVTTPQARPLPEGQEQSKTSSTKFRRNQTPSLNLPPAALTDSTLSHAGTINGADSGSKSHGAFTTGNEYRTSEGINHNGYKPPSEANDQKNPMSSSSQQVRLPLRLEAPYDIEAQRSSTSGIKRLSSADSFLLFSTSSDESHPKFSLPNSLDSTGGQVRQTSAGEDQDSLEYESPISYDRHKQAEADLWSSGMKAVQGLETRRGWSEPGPPHDRRSDAGTEFDDGHLNLDLTTRGEERPGLGPIRTGNSLQGSRFGPAPKMPAALAKMNSVPASIPSTSKPTSKYPLTDDPFSTTALLGRVIDYYISKQADVLTASHLLLFFQPYLPAETINKQRVSSIFKTYHSQLLSKELFLEAANLRNVCYPAYETVYEASHYDVEMQLLCKSCGGKISPLPSSQNRGRHAWACEKCGKIPAPCPVCRSNQGRRWWSWCQSCGHGGHASCLTEWWQNKRSGERCAVEGCMHVCVRDKRRPKKMRSGKSKAKPVVRKDDWVVDESRAVERLRSDLGGTNPEPVSPAAAAAFAAGGAGGGGGGGNIKEGRHQTEKRVKVITPSKDDGGDS